MKRIPFLSLLCLFVILPISVVTAEISFNWIRTGVVLEAEHKSTFEHAVSVGTRVNWSTNNRTA